jgi:hypothetical protein
MDGVTAFLVFSILGAIVLRLIGRRDKDKRLGPATPARFLYFTGKRLVTMRRVHAYSLEE